MGIPLRSLTTQPIATPRHPPTAQAFQATLTFAGRNHEAIIDPTTPANILSSTRLLDPEGPIEAYYDGGVIPMKLGNEVYQVIGVAFDVPVENVFKTWNTQATFYVVENFPVTMLLGEPWLTENNIEVDIKPGTYLNLGIRYGDTLNRSEFHFPAINYLANPPHGLAQPLRSSQPPPRPLTQLDIIVEQIMYPSLSTQPPVQFPRFRLV